VFQVKGFCLPDGETHLVSYLETGPMFAGGPTYQLHKLLGVLPHVKNFRRAIDVGAHCGLWSRPMSHMFSNVEAFERVAAHRECFIANVPSDAVTLYDYALGNQEGTVYLHTGAASSGDTYVVPPDKGGEHSAEMRTLDSFNFESVDFIKIDCEGFEYFVLLGGEKTVRKHKPTIIVEQKPGKGAQFGLADTAACKLLESWGAAKVYEHGGDYGYRFK